MKNIITLKFGFLPVLILISAIYCSCQKVPGSDLVSVKKFIPINDVVNYGFQVDPKPSDFIEDETFFLTPEDNATLRRYGIKKGLKMVVGNNSRNIWYIKKYAAPIDSMYIQTVFYMKNDPSNFDLTPQFIGVNNALPKVVNLLDITVTPIDSSLWEVRKTFKVPYSGGYNTVYIGSEFLHDPASYTSDLTVSGFYCKSSRSNPVGTNLVVTNPD